MSLLSIVGVGPGDPELITLKGAKALQCADVILAPVAKEGEKSVALSTVEHLLTPSNQEILQLVFPMTTDHKLLTTAWEQAAKAVEERLADGKKVSFITIGDPLFYSTSIYLIDLFSKRGGKNIEIIPGVTSFCAAAAESAISIVEGDSRFAVIPATAGIDAVISAIEAFDTVVILKVKPLFKEIVAFLEQKPEIGRTVFAERVGSERQLILDDLADIKLHNPDYLSLLMVRKG